MFKKKNAKGKRELVLIYTSEKIYAVLRTPQGILARNEFLPELDLSDIFLWGKKQNATSVRILKLADVYDLEIDWAEDAEFEENVEALNYEVASLSGLNTEDIRPAMLAKNNINDCKHGLFTSTFSLKDIKKTVQQSAHSKLQFQGIASLQQTLIVYHFSRDEYKNDVLLFFMRAGAFAAVLEHGKIMLRNMPFGMPDNSSTEKQWETRAQRRLNSFAGRNIKLYLEQEHDGFKEKLKNVIGTENISECLISDIFPDLVNVISSGEMNINCAFNLAGIPPRVKDPREAGTMICLLLIGITSVMLLFQFLQLKITENTLGESLKDKKNMQSTIESQEAQLDSIQKQLAKMKKLYEIIKSRKHINPNFITILNLLSRYPLKYTKIKTIQEQHNGTVITGETYWQPDLSKFFAHFEKQLTKRGLSLMPEGLKKIDEMRLSFKCRISKR